VGEDEKLTLWPASMDVVLEEADMVGSLLTVTVTEYVPDVPASDVTYRDSVPPEPPDHVGFEAELATRPDQSNVPPFTSLKPALFEKVTVCPASTGLGDAETDDKDGASGDPEYVPLLSYVGYPAVVPVTEKLCELGVEYPGTPPNESVTVHVEALLSSDSRTRVLPGAPDLPLASVADADQELISDESPLSVTSMNTPYVVEPPPPPGWLYGL
jgi:hypothetical protein